MLMAICDLHSLPPLPFAIGDNVVQPYGGGDGMKTEGKWFYLSIFKQNVANPFLFVCL